MKKRSEKWILLCIVVMLVSMMFTTTAFAAVDFPKSKTFYLEKKGSNQLSYGELDVYNLDAGESISRTSLKSSAASVIQPVLLQKSISIDQDMDGNMRMSETDTIQLNYYKTGTSKLSFKVGNKTYSSTLKVLPYVNPLLQLKLSSARNGASANLAGITSQGCDTMKTLRLQKNQNDAILTVKAASGWKVVSVSYRNEQENMGKNYSSRGVSTVTMHLGKMNTKSKSTLYITLQNSKTGGTLSCRYKII